MKFVADKRYQPIAGTPKALGEHFAIAAQLGSLQFVELLIKIYVPGAEGFRIDTSSTPPEDSTATGPDLTPRIAWLSALYGAALFGQPDFIADFITKYGDIFKTISKDLLQRYLSFTIQSGNRKAVEMTLRLFGRTEADLKADVFLDQSQPRLRLSTDYLRWLNSLGVRVTPYIQQAIVVSAFRHFDFELLRFCLDDPRWDLAKVHQLVYEFSFFASRFIILPSPKEMS